MTRFYFILSTLGAIAVALPMLVGLSAILLNVN